MPAPLPPKPPNSDQVDPLLESLLENARPILAKERGLNQKSRMKIQAIGRQMKIPAAVIDQAIQILHGAPPVQGSEVSTYESNYATIMREKISEIPGGILTTKIEEKAISIGVRKYQLSEVQARRIVRQIADEVSIPRVSLNAAERHVEQEIAEVIGEETWITGEKKERLLKNAKRLGIASDQVKSIIQRHLQFNFQQVRNERKFTDRLWVVAACIVVFLGFGLFVYTQLQPRKNETETTAKQKNEKDSVSKKISAGEREPKSPDWWDDDLKVLLQKTRLRVNGFSEVHDRMKGASPTNRAKLYQDLLRLDEGQLNSQSIRERIQLLLPALFKADPEMEAIEGMLSGFANAIKIPNGSIPDQSGFFSKSFWALELVNEIISDESLADDKSMAIQKMMTETCDRKLDLFLSEENRLQKQRNALLEKYFAHLIDIGSAFPVASPDIFAKLTELSYEAISEEKIQQFRYLFLVSFLRFESENWTNCATMIDSTIADSTVTQLSFFIDLMETSEDEALQSFLQSRLHRRAGFGGDPGTIAETATELRRYFELDTMAAKLAATPKRELLDVVINRFANKWTLKPTNLGTPELAQIWAEATYVTTLVMLEGNPEPSDFHKLIDIGFPNLNSATYVAQLQGDDDSDSGGDKVNNLGGDTLRPDIGDMRNRRQELQDSLRILNQFKRLKPPARIAQIKRIATLASTIDALAGAESTILADYLLTKKNDAEAAEVDQVIPEFRGWNRLFVAIADQLLIEDYQRERAVEVCSRLMNRDIKIDEADWAERLSRLLLQEAQARAYVGEVTKQKKSDPLVTLKKSLGILYSLRANAMGLSTQSIAADNLDAILELIISDYKNQLSLKKLEKDKSVADLQSEIVDTLGNDPLTRFSLMQDVMLSCLKSLSTPKKQTGASGESMLKLSNLMERRVKAYPTVIAQIVERELEILTVLYQQNND